MDTSKKAITASSIGGKIASIVGYTLSSISLIIVILALADMSATGAKEVLVIFSVILFGGLAGIRGGFRIKRRVKRFKRYVSLISNEKMTSLENLAVSTSRTVDFVRKDLETMINKCYFANASLNAATNEIVIARQVAYVNPLEIEIYNCPGCGATGTKQKGTIGSCEYCGSLIG